MPKPRPSELEMQVLSLLWERGPSTVRFVLEHLPDGKPRAYTTVLTVLQGMEKKRLVSHTRDGLAHVYQPRVSRNEVVRPFMKTLLQNVFGGSPTRVMQALVDQQDLSEAELREIRKVINTAARQKRKEGE